MPQRQIPRPIQQPKPVIQQPQQIIPPPKQVITPKIQEIPAPAKIGKAEEVLSWLNDIYITSIECQGAGKTIIIKKNKQIMRAPITLNEEEINKVIIEFSERARIPLVEGMLRARLEQHGISAIVSISGGSRFIITRLPSTQPHQQQMKIQTTPLPPQTKPPMMPPINRPFVSNNQNQNIQQKA